MSTIVTRAGKGSPLTNNELDANFVNLNTDKYQSGDSASFAQVAVDNILVNGNTISSTDTDGNIILSPNGSGTVDVASSKITGLATPTLSTDAVTKAYVDTLVASGIHYHAPVRVESPTNLNATYNNGTAGVGATLTNAGTQAALVIDGVTVSVNDRVLIYAQTNQTQNGVYVVTTVGSGSTNWVLTRATDADEYGLASASTLGEGSTVYVTAGTTGAGEAYVCNTTGTITFGTTNITFAQISSAQIYSAGTALSLTGTQFAVSLVPIANGGTGQTTANAALNALLPSQATHANKFLKTDGTNTAWANVPSPNNGTLSLAVSGTGLSGSASFTADQSGNSTFTVTSNATSANTVSTIVARDASGNFSAGTITAALSGNATTATTASATSAALTAGTYLTSGGSFNGSTARTFAVDATDANTASKVVARDASGNFSAGTITAALSGNATTATTLQTARTINGVSFNGSANITVTATATNALTLGSYLTGTSYNGSGAVTAAVDATSANTANKVVARDGSGGFSAGAVSVTSLTASGDVTSNSDERLKTNWRSVQEDFVTKLAGVKSGVYDRTDIEATQAGVSAQSLEEVLAEVVVTAPDGLKSVNYGNAALVAAIELAKQVVELRKEIAELKGK
jgi:hypothetical protein